MFTAQDVKNLREMTGCGMMDCKKALTETNGDVEKAIEFLREKGLASAAKKSGRIAAEGLVDAMEQDGVSVVLEVNSETDFVAKNEEFQNFVKDVMKHIIAVNPESVEVMLDQKFMNTGNETIRDMLTAKIAKIGENMNIRRFERYEGVAQTYIHGGGRIGVVVGFDVDASAAAKPEFSAYAKDVAMQIAAVYPQYVTSDEVSAETIEKEKEILMAQAINEGKPANIAEKMVAGRIAKFFKEVCLVDQEFVKDGDKTVGSFTKEISAQIGAEITITKFARLEKGAGLEKREDNFADEVANMVK